MSLPPQEHLLKNPRTFTSLATYITAWAPILITRLYRPDTWPSQLPGNEFSNSPINMEVSGVRHTESYRYNRIEGVNDPFVQRLDQRTSSIGTACSTTVPAALHGSTRQSNRPVSCCSSLIDWHSAVSDTHCLLSWPMMAQQSPNSPSLAEPLIVQRAWARPACTSVTCIPQDDQQKLILTIHISTAL
jgi:hypothetical protein